MKLRIFLMLFVLPLSPVQALVIDQSITGLVDLRYSFIDGISSYTDGNYGKFQFDDGDQLPLAQAALSYKAEFNSRLSAHLIGNGYAGTQYDGFGLTEAYLQYRGLPSQQGLRVEARAGFIYPRVSVENVLTAWSSPYTLDYSSLNSWLAEEVRHQGIEVSIKKLGKFVGNKQDFSAGLAVFRDNDPTGAMLAWHGWVISSRQSLRHETLPLPRLQPGFVPDASDPFLELDDRLGYHAWLQWDRQGSSKVLLGYYDNNADPEIAEDLQWAWTTRFTHLGIKWKLAANLDLLAQYLHGSTLMQSTRSGQDLVYNYYHSAFVMLSKKLGKHRFTTRLEEFAVTDEDDISSDNNNEYGKALTLSYAYRLGKHWFLHSEFTAIRSWRPSRVLYQESESLTERQTQLALRYFF